MGHFTISMDDSSRVIEVGNLTGSGKVSDALVPLAIVVNSTITEISLETGISKDNLFQAFSFMANANNNYRTHFRYESEELNEDISKEKVEKDCEENSNDISDELIEDNLI